MILKKIRTLLFSLFIIFVLTACGGSNSPRVRQGSIGDLQTDSSIDNSTEHHVDSSKVVSPLSIVAAQLRPGQSVKFTKSNLVSTLSRLLSFDLISKANGKTPFTAGLAFKKGDVPETPTLDLENYQVEVKRRWNDGSAKHAIVSGYYGSTSGQPTMVKVFSSGILPTGSALAESDIVIAAPSASVQLGALGIVYLVDLLGSPERVWTSGPNMVEVHYYKTLSSNPHYTVKFHVRLFSGGEIFVRAIVENGDINRGHGEDIAYIPTVTIGEMVVYNNDSSVLTHFEHQRWDVTGWINISDPQVMISMDTDYLMGSKLVPNYWKTGPSQKALDNLSQTYSPLQKGDWTKRMWAAGYQAQIGLLPLWDALYLNSFGAPAAYRSVIANARSINSYPIVWPDPVLNQPIIISSYPTHTVYGAKGGGSTSWNAGVLSWDIAHHGSAAYLAYLITGDYYFLETMQYQAALCYLFTISSRGSGIKRVIKPVQTRGVAWATRTYGQLAGIAPLDNFTKDMISMLDFSASYWKNVIERQGMNQLGYIYAYETYDSSKRTLAPWMQNFWIQTNGYVSDIEYSSDMTNFDFVKQHMYQGVVGLLGPNGVDNYCYTGASAYTITVSDSPSADAATWFDSWGDVWEATTGAPNTSCGTTLSGYVGASAKTTYLGNLLPALAYAVEDGAPGAVQGLERLMSADNWSGVENGGWEDVPVWGVMPRAVGEVIED